MNNQRDLTRLQFGVALIIQYATTARTMYLWMVAGLCENECDLPAWEREANIYALFSIGAMAVAILAAVHLIRRPPPDGYAGTRIALRVGIATAVLVVLPGFIIGTTFIPV